MGSVLYKSLVSDHAKKLDIFKGQSNSSKTGYKIFRIDTVGNQLDY